MKQYLRQMSGGRRVGLGVCLMLVGVFAIHGALAEGSSLVPGRERWHGFWFNQRIDHGVHVMSSLEPNNVDSFVSTVRSRWNGEGNNRIGAAYLVCVMMGVDGDNCPRNFDAELFGRWEALVRAYDARSLVNFNASHPIRDGDANTYQQQRSGGNDIAWYILRAGSGGEHDTLPGRNHPSIVFFHPDTREPIMVIRRACGNPIGTLIPLPPIEDGMFESHSTVTVQMPAGVAARRTGNHASGWDGVAHVVYTIAAGPDTIMVPVGFHHDIRRTDDGTELARTDWEVFESGSPAISPVPGPRRHHVSLEGGDEEEVSRTVPVGVSLAGGVAQDGVSATLARAGVQFVNVAAQGRTGPICQRIRYSPKDLDDERSWGDSIACVTFIREQEPPIRPPECVAETICGIPMEICTRDRQVSGFEHGQARSFTLRDVEVDVPAFFGSYSRNDELLRETFRVWDWGCDPVYCWDCDDYGCWSWVCGCNPWQRTRSPDPHVHNGVFMRQVGTTGGRSFARNSNIANPNNLEDWWYMGDMDLEALYARPTDTIDFCHGAFMGAQMVEHDNRADSRRMNDNAHNWCSISAMALKSEGGDQQTMWPVSNPFLPSPREFRPCGQGRMERTSEAQEVRGNRYTVDVGQTMRQRIEQIGIASANTTPRRANMAKFAGSRVQHCSIPCGQSGHDSTEYHHDLGTNLGNVGGTHQTDFAVVRVPFNYDITTHISGTQFDRANVANRSVAVAGSIWDINAFFSVDQVTNPKLEQMDHSDPLYATITKDTTWQLTKMVFAPNQGAAYDTATSLAATTVSGAANGPCAHARSNITGELAYCGVAVNLENGNPVRLSNNGSFESADVIPGRAPIDNRRAADQFGRAVYNTVGGLTGAGSAREGLMNEKSFYVDDLLPGSTICYMFSVFPASGDDRGGDQTDLNQTDAGDKWAHSEPVCVIVGKRPSASVQGAGLLAGGVRTNQTNKTPCFRAPDFTFVGLGNTTHCWDNMGGDGVGTRSVFGSWAEYEIIARGNADGRMASGSKFAFTPLPTRDIALGGRTFRSMFVPSGGYAWGPGGNAFDGARATIGMNYRMDPTWSSDFPDDGTHMYMDDSPGHNRLMLANAGAFGNFDTGNMNRAFGIYSLTTRLTQLEGDHVQHFTSLPSGAITVGAGQTRIYTINGTATIRGNIRIHDGYRNLTDMAQVIIIADNIRIAPNVTQIDAWLITRPGGMIHTCDGHDSVEVLSSNICNQRLIVNGPIITSDLRKMRTAGAGIGVESADPAEIFNLRADAYLWTFWQIHSNRAVRTTFSHEMPPRL